VHFALHESWCAITTVTQQPHDFAHRLAGALIGNAVNHNNGDAIGFAHRPVRITSAWSLKQILWRDMCILSWSSGRGRAAAFEVVGNFDNDREGFAQMRKVRTHFQAHFTAEVVSGQCEKKRRSQA